MWIKQGRNVDFEPIRVHAEMIDRYHGVAAAMHDRIDWIYPREHAFGGAIPDRRFPDSFSLRGRR
jgi:hypothetical protein